MAWGMDLAWVPAGAARPRSGRGWRISQGRTVSPPPGNRVAGYGHNLSRSQKRQHLLDALFDLALTGASQELQVSAAVAWLNRYEGRPVAMTVHASAADLSTLDDADLEHELRLHAADTQAKRQKN